MDNAVPSWTRWVRSVLFVLGVIEIAIGVHLLREIEASETRTAIETMQQHLHDQGLTSVSGHDLRFKELPRDLSRYVRGGRKIDPVLAHWMSLFFQWFGVACVALAVLGWTGVQGWLVGLAQRRAANEARPTGAAEPSDGSDAAGDSEGREE